MAIAAKSGFLADFKIGYLQRAIIEHRAEVIGGVDTQSGKTGFAVSRLVKLIRLGDGSCIISTPIGVSATSIGDATHIIAQSDDSLRNVPSDAIKTEQYTTRGSNILANTSEEELPADQTAANLLSTTITMKSVALYKIVNADDIKIIPVAPATVTVNR